MFAFHFLSVRGVSGETEFIPHLAKMGRELQREKARQPGNLKKRKEELDVGSVRVSLHT